MRFFNKHFSFLIVIFCLPLLFLPKINLVSFPGRETAGIRLDDVLLLFLFLIVFWAHFALNRRLKDIEFWIFILMAFSFFSFILNRFFVSLGILHVDSIIFYCVRLFEYFVFFYIGSLCSLFMKARTVIKVFFCWNLMIMVLQKAAILGQFTVDGYNPNVSYRVGGIASFPSEAGLLIDMIFCFLIYDQERESKFLRLLPPLLKTFIEKTYVYWLFLLCAVFVILTGSRIAIVALVITFLFKLKEELSWRSLHSWIVAVLFISLASLIMVMLIINTASLFRRSDGLFSFRNFELVAKVWENVDLSHDPIGFETVRNESYDTSWWIRAHKWCYALKIYYLHPECYLQGIGPGFAMAGLDGGFLRIFTEYGIVGCFLFWKLFSRIYQKSKQLKWMVIAFLINMIFFDVYLAYKPMSLLFLVVGYAYSASEKYSMRVHASRFSLMMQKPNSAVSIP
jgi:hypothetical protein